jgi:hypothetical protein
LLNAARTWENSEAVIERKMVGKAGVNNQRSALGNISNKAVISSNTDGVKVYQTLL